MNMAKNIAYVVSSATIPILLLMHTLTPILGANAWLLVGLSLYELARFIVHRPNPFLLAVHETPFVPELAIGMVSLP